MAKQKVALECLSYHATASRSQTNKLIQDTIRSAESYALYSFKFIGEKEENSGNLIYKLIIFLHRLRLVRRRYVSSNDSNVPAVQSRATIPYSIRCMFMIQTSKTQTYSFHSEFRYSAVGFLAFAKTIDHSSTTIGVTASMSPRPCSLL